MRVYLCFSLQGAGWDTIKQPTYKNINFRIHADHEPIFRVSSEKSA